MKIIDLKSGQGKVDIEVDVISVEEARAFEKFGREIKVANAVVKDDSGTMKMTLWNQEIDNVKAGNKVKITNGFVNEFQGEKQLTAGKFGKLEVLGAEEVEAGMDEEGNENPEEEYM